MNVETLLVQAFNAQPGIPEAFMDVPNPRPPKFLTVERVGGDQADVRDRPIVSVQVWDESRWKASETALIIADFLRGLALIHPNVARVTVESVYNNPDPDSEQPRYQVNTSMTTV